MRILSCCWGLGRTLLLLLLFCLPVSAQTMTLVADFPPEIVTRGTISTPTAVDTRTISTFSTGKWITWTVRGNVTFTFTKTAGPYQTVMGALLTSVTDDAGAPDIAYVGIDTTTHGNYRRLNSAVPAVWAQTYGDRGILMALEDRHTLAASILPFISSSTYNFPPLGDSIDPNALVRVDTPGGPGATERRFNAAWISDTIVVELSVGPSLVNVSFYLFDVNGEGVASSVAVAPTAARAPSTNVDGYQLKLVDHLGATAHTETVSLPPIGGYDQQLPIAFNPAWFPVVEEVYTASLRYKIYGGSTYTSWTAAPIGVIKDASGNLRTDGVPLDEDQGQVLSFNLRSLLRRD